MKQRYSKRYIEILTDYYNKKKSKNPLFSLRSFAKFLDIPCSSLSNILKGKRGISKETAIKIADKLKMSEEEGTHFIDTVLASDARSKQEKLEAINRLKNISGKKVIDEDVFSIMSQWYYFTIIEMTSLLNFKSDHNWIAAQLGITEAEVDQAMSTLLRLDFISLVDGNYLSKNTNLNTLNDIPSKSIKQHNIQMLEKAKNAILNQDVKSRESGTLTIAINEDDIEFVKNEIRNFKSQLNQDLMSRTKHNGADKVYAMSVQFFNLLEES